MRPPLLSRRLEQGWRCTCPRYIAAQSRFPQRRVVRGIQSGSRPIEEETTPNYSPQNFLPVRLGDVYGGRFQIISKLGYGTGSTVWLVKDTRRWRWLGDRYFTLKALTKNYSDSPTKSELDISQMLKTKNPKHPGFNYVRTVHDSFVVPGPSGSHLCLLYLPMRETLATFQRRLRRKRVPHDFLKPMLSILLKGLSYLHDECHVIHTGARRDNSVDIDIARVTKLTSRRPVQPDNILVGIEEAGALREMEHDEKEEPTPFKQSDDGRRIYLRQNFGDLRDVPGRPKISDFGLAVVSDGAVPRHHPIQPNLFQAPEVLLGAGWSFSADFWNLGAMIWDLLEGPTLFRATDPRDGGYRPDLHLQEMVSLLGCPPQDLRAHAQAANDYFAPDGRLRSIDIPCSSDSPSTLEDNISRIPAEEK